MKRSHHIFLKKKEREKENSIQCFFSFTLWQPNKLNSFWRCSKSAKRKWLWLIANGTLNRCKWHANTHSDEHVYFIIRCITYCICTNMGSFYTVQCTIMLAYTLQTSTYKIHIKLVIRSTNDWIEHTNKQASKRCRLLLLLQQAFFSAKSME